MIYNISINPLYIFIKFLNVKNHSYRCRLETTESVRCRARAESASWTWARPQPASLQPTKASCACPSEPSAANACHRSISRTPDPV